MRVSTYKEAPETCFAAPQVIAGVQLVVAQLEILMLAVVLPPGTLETGSVGEMSVQRIILDAHVGDGAEAVVARHIGKVVEQIGLDAQQFPAFLDGGSWFRERHFHIDVGLWKRQFCMNELCLGQRDGIHEPFVYRHDSHGTQLREIFLEQRFPESSSVVSLQSRLERFALAVVFPDVGFHHRQLLIVLHLHQREEERIILGHHIISDAIDVDAEFAEQGIHGCSTAPG